MTPDLDAIRARCEAGKLLWHSDGAALLAELDAREATIERQREKIAELERHFDMLKVELGRAQKIIEREENRAETAERELARLREENERIRGFVSAQAMDEGLWFEARTASEGYLQQELRALHRKIEGDQ